LRPELRLRGVARAQDSYAQISPLVPQAAGLRPELRLRGVARA
jgi:hypothetical protein